MARRFDSSQVTSVEKTPQGYLKVTAPITRAGIFEYRRGDGTIVRELRKPDEVFKGDSLASFDGVSLVNTDERFPGVPAGHSPMLTPENTAQFQKGVVMKPTRLDTHMEATILVTDAKTIADIEAGKRELSAGYSCDVVDETGEWNGQKYDAVQECIVGNHVALVRRGRAGSSVSIRLDSADAELVASDSGAEVREEISHVKTRKMKFDAAEVEVEESLAALIESERNAQAAALKNSQSETAKHNARGDSAEAALAEVRKQLEVAPAKIRAEVQGELALHSRARQVLGADARFDGQDTAAVKTAVLTKLGVKTEGKDPVYVAARFDAEMDRFEAGTAPVTRTEAIKADAVDELEAKIEAMNKASREAYKGKA